LIIFAKKIIERQDMTKKQTIQLFEEKKVRAVWDDEQEKWYFSIVDVCGVLTDQPDYEHAKNYWKVLKHRLLKEGNETVTNCNQLSLIKQSSLLTIRTKTMESIL
jgi:prophage antirepressor-like protein